MASRFDSPSVSLRLGILLKHSRVGLRIALGLAIIGHAASSRLGGLTETERITRPLTTQFVKRQPRLTKPLEMKKRPRPKKRQLRRQMVAVRAQTHRTEPVGGIRGFALAGRLARPSVEVWRTTRFEGAEMEPEALAQTVEGSKEAKNVVDMSLEMMDVEALDTGRYHALVIQDPTDKGNIKGFFRLKYAYCKSQMVGFLLTNDWRVIHALRSMIEAMNYYTDIKASYEGKILFTSREMIKTPWVFLYHGSDVFAFSDADATSLGNYLMCGGFVLADATDSIAPRGNEKRIPINLTSAHNNLRLAMASQRQEYGRDWTFEILPNDHPIFHSYFDFEGAPGSLADTEMYLSGKLEGITVDGRLLLAICQKALLHIWGDPLNPQMREERMVQFGVNTVIFALTQEGSITHRVVDEVR